MLHITPASTGAVSELVNPLRSNTVLLQVHSAHAFSVSTDAVKKTEKSTRRRRELRREAEPEATQLPSFFIPVCATSKCYGKLTRSTMAPPWFPASQGSRLEEIRISPHGHVTPERTTSGRAASAPSCQTRALMRIYSSTPRLPA